MSLAEKPGGTWEWMLPAFPGGINLGRKLSGGEALTVLHAVERKRGGYFPSHALSGRK